MVKLTEKQWQVVHAVAGFVIVLTVANVANAQDAAGGALVFLDKIREFFLGIVNHPVWPTILGVWFLASVVLYAKSHDVRALLSAVGAAAGGGIWVARSGVWSSITGYTF